jgi:hypothetical protein
VAEMPPAHATMSSILGLFAALHIAALDLNVVFIFFSTCGSQVLISERKLILPTPARCCSSNSRVRMKAFSRCRGRRLSLIGGDPTNCRNSCVARIGGNPGNRSGQHLRRRSQISERRSNRLARTLAVGPLRCGLPSQRDSGTQRSVGIIWGPYGRHPSVAGPNETKRPPDRPHGCHCSP